MSGTWQHEKQVLPRLAVSLG